MIKKSQMCLFWPIYDAALQDWTEALLRLSVTRSSCHWLGRSLSWQLLVLLAIVIPPSKPSVAFHLQAKCFSHTCFTYSFI